MRSLRAERCATPQFQLWATGRVLPEDTDFVRAFPGVSALCATPGWRGISIPHFSPGFVARRRRRAWLQGARREDSAGVLDSTSRSPTERNAGDMPGSAAAVETW